MLLVQHFELKYLRNQIKVLENSKRTLEECILQCVKIKMIRAVKVLAEKK